MNILHIATYHLQSEARTLLLDLKNVHKANIPALSTCSTDETDYTPLIFKDTAT